MKHLLFMNDHVGPGAVATIVRRPMTTPVRPLRLRVLTMGKFDILDIRVGNKSQLETSGPIAAEVFARHRVDHIEAIARWIEESRGYKSLADSIRNGAWKSADHQDDEDFIDFPCHTIQTAMDFVMEVRNRDERCLGLFCAIWVCEEVILNGGIHTTRTPPSSAEMEVITRRMQTAAEAMSMSPCSQEPPSQPKPPAETFLDRSGVGWDPYGDE